MTLLCWGGNSKRILPLTSAFSVYGGNFKSCTIHGFLRKPYAYPQKHELVLFLPEMCICVPIDMHERYLEYGPVAMGYE
jgi:hypothetical protein